MTMRARSTSLGHALRTGRLRAKARTDCVLAAASWTLSSSSAAYATSSSSCKFQLIDQPLRALAARPVLLALQLADQQLQMHVERLNARQPRLRVGRFRLSLQPRSTFGQQRRMSAGKVRWQGKRRQCHNDIESDFSTISMQKFSQTRLGRQVSCRARQSIPSSDNAC